MTQRFLSVFVLLFCLSGEAWADDPCQSNSSPFGPINCGAGVVQRIDANGPVILNDTLVKGATNVNGILTGDKVSLGSLTVNGRVQLTHSTVSGSVNINGLLTASNTNFGDTILVFSNAIQLTDCKTSAITIGSSSDGVVSPQTLTLQGDTEVDGNITFQHNGGVVNADSTVKINGKVIGGTLNVHTVTLPSTTAANGTNLVKPARVIPTAPTVPRITPAPRHVAPTTSTSTSSVTGVAKP